MASTKLNRLILAFRNQLWIRSKQARQKYWWTGFWSLNLKSKKPIIKSPGIYPGAFYYFSGDDVFGGDALPLYDDNDGDAWDVPGPAPHQ